MKASELEQISLSDIQKALRHFGKTLTASNKYFLLNRDNVTQPVQMQLSLKEKIFSKFFSEVLKFR